MVPVVKLFDFCEFKRVSYIVLKCHVMRFDTFTLRTLIYFTYLKRLYSSGELLALFSCPLSDK